MQGVRVGGEVMTWQEKVAELKQTPEYTNAIDEVRDSMVFACGVFHQADELFGTIMEGHDLGGLIDCPLCGKKIPCWKSSFNGHVGAQCTCMSVQQ